jgi:purine-nucleoside phosphorylase
MLNEFAQKIKGAAINVAMKYMTKKDKLSQIFFATMANSFAPIVLLPASHTVWKKLHDRLKNPEKHGLIESGSMAGVRVTLIRSGVGTPAMANVMEVLKEVVPKAIIRVDYAGSLSATLPVGAVFTATSAFPGDGTTAHYIHAHVEDQDFLKQKGVDPAIPATSIDPVYTWLASRGLTGSIPCNMSLRAIASAAAKVRGTEMVEGMIWTTDGLFTESRDKVTFWQAMGAKAVDMETSCLYLLARQANIPAIAIHGISDNVVTQKPFFELDHFDPAVESSIDHAITIIETMLHDI